MALQLQNKLLQILLLRAMVAAILVASQVIQPDCQDKCGDLSIPYPFGTTANCYLNQDFLISCNETASPPTAFLWTSNLVVKNISLEGELRVLTYIARDCYNSQGGGNGKYDILTTLPRFPFSTTRNKFTAIGCDTLALIQRRDGQLTTGCMSMCNSMDNVTDGSCSGIGCCQITIPKGLLNYNATVRSINGNSNRSAIWSFSPCSYAFLIEGNSFHFSMDNLTNIQNIGDVPTVLDWAIGDQTCEEARKNSSSFAC